MKFTQWVQESAAVKLQRYDVVRDNLHTILEPDTEILQSAVTGAEEAPGFKWRKRFTLLSPNTLATGHLGYPLATPEDGRDDAEFEVTIIPVDSIATVSYRAHETAAGMQHCYTLTFKDGRAPMTLPPDAGRFDTNAYNGYVAIGKALLGMLGSRT